MPIAIRADRIRKNLSEQNWTDHECDPADAAERALQLSLLGRFYAARHQTLHRRIRKSRQSSQRNAAPEYQAGRGEPADDETRDIERESREHRVTLAETRDYRLHHAAADDRRAYPDGCDREANSALAPSVAIHRVEHERGRHRLVRDTHDEVHRRESEQLDVRANQFERSQGIRARPTKRLAPIERQRFGQHE